MREVELRLGHPDELDRTRGGVGDDETVGIGHADVFRRQDHESPSDEARVLPCGDHAREPVEAGVDVGATDALDERRQHVVVLVVAVAECAHAPSAASLSASVIDAPPGLGGQRRRDVERRERVASVALGAIGEMGERVVIDGEVLVAEATRLVGERALQAARATRRR